MGKLQWIPWMALAGLEQAAKRLPEAALASGETGYTWSPAADVVETATAFTVTLELPGVDREAISVVAKGCSLLVSGVRRVQTHHDGEVYQLMERSYGPFLRRFTLPRDCVAQAVEAVLKDGVLTVTVHKALSECRHRRIPVG